MKRELDPSENLKLFDKLRMEAIGRTNEAIICVKELMEDDDFEAYGKKNLEKLEYSRHILQNNTLPLSLMASFQQGKSTTTSAMADGHEITPCGRGGGGIRTSSIPVTIYNDANSTEVVVNPYTKMVLTQHIIACCTAHLDNADPTAYDLDSKKNRRLLQAAVESEIKNYRDAADYDPDQLSVLRSAVLILAYYGSGAYQKLVSDGFKTILDIQPFIAFPSDLESRWEKLRDYGFDIVNQTDDHGNALFDELSSLYVFVDNIVVPVHSEFMGETGTAIIDAPGTMASSEDTERALKAAESAAVVLFLLTGERQLSKVDRDMLCNLKEAGMANKVVFIVNFFKNPDIIKDNIEQTILVQIREAGYTAEHHTKLLYYNAYLAQRAAQGQLILEDRMDPLTADSILIDAKKRFKREIEFTSVEEAWLKTTIKTLRAIDADDAADELSDLGLCKQTIETISRESRWREMITCLREHVMNNRVSGVLKDLGVKPVFDGLKSIEDALEAREKAANDTEEKVKREYEEAKRLLEQFSDEVSDVVSLNLSQSTDKAFAESYYDDVVLGSIDEAAEMAAPEVFEKTGIIGNVKDIADKTKRLLERAANCVSEFFSGRRPVYEHEPNGLKEQCNAVISRCYRKQMMLKGHAWSQNLEGSYEYKDYIEKKVRHIQKSFRRTWEDLGLDQNELLSNIAPLPGDLSGLISKDAANLGVRDIISDTSAAVQLGIGALFKGVGMGFGTLVGGTWVYYFVLPVDFIIPGFAEIITLAAVIVAAAVYAVAAGKKAKKVESISEEISTGLSKTVSHKKKEIIDNIMKGDMNAVPPAPGISYIRLFYQSLFDGIVERQRADLDKTYQAKMEDLKKSSADRMRIAGKANRWRTEQIGPIREKLSDILDEIDDIWGE